MNQFPSCLPGAPWTPVSSGLNSRCTDSGVHTPRASLGLGPGVASLGPNTAGSGGPASTLQRAAQSVRGVSCAPGGIFVGFSFGFGFAVLLRRAPFSFLPWRLASSPAVVQKVTHSGGPDVCPPANAAENPPSSMECRALGSRTEEPAPQAVPPIKGPGEADRRLSLGARSCEPRVVG